MVFHIHTGDEVRKFDCIQTEIKSNHVHYKINNSAIFMQNNTFFEILYQTSFCVLLSPLIVLYKDF